MAKNNLKTRLFKGIIANGLGQIVTVVIQVVSLPIFLHSWGKELYGEWLILSAIPAYLSLSDIGFSTAATNEMAMKVAQGDRATALEVFQSIWLLISGISFTTAMTLTFTTYFIPIKNWLKLTHLTENEVSLITLLLALYVIVGMQTSLLIAGFTCEGNYAIGVFYASLVRLFEFGIVILVVYLGASPTMAALFFLAMRGIGTIAMRLVLIKKSPWIVYGYCQAKFSTIRRLAKPALACFSFPLGNAINNQGIIILIASLLTPTDVVVFSTLRTLSRLALQLMGMIKNAVSPEISAAYAIKNMTLARKLHRHACQVSIWLSFFTVAGLITTGDWLIIIWTQGAIVMNFSLFYLMLINVIFSSFWYTSLVVITAVNQHQRVAALYLMANVFSLILAKFMLPLWGLNGAAFSLLIIDITMSIVVLNNSLHLVEDNLLSYLKFVIFKPQLTLFFNK
jgi:O-antigen/teichoic acid export membrane protein